MIGDITKKNTLIEPILQLVKIIVTQTGKEIAAKDP